ncbi:MAG: hypothetical protein A2X86_01660 [Bdellovibrionales bacterium GWA2_49_15]|nr:MAG: hypothetical protein A2X86_01660 [Bdellovibrionales bacterium GWA2_49_15]
MAELGTRLYFMPVKFQAFTEKWRVSWPLGLTIFWATSGGQGGQLHGTNAQVWRMFVDKKIIPEYYG